MHGERIERLPRTDVDRGEMKAEPVVKERLVKCTSSASSRERPLRKAQKCSPMLSEVLLVAKVRAGPVYASQGGLHGAPSKINVRRRQIDNRLQTMYDQKKWIINKCVYFLLYVISNMRGPLFWPFY